MKMKRMTRAVACVVASIIAATSAVADWCPQPGYPGQWTAWAPGPTCSRERILEGCDGVTSSQFDCDSCGGLASYYQECNGTWNVQLGEYDCDKEHVTLNEEDCKATQLAGCNSGT